MILLPRDYHLDVDGNPVCSTRGTVAATGVPLRTSRQPHTVLCKPAFRAQTISVLKDPKQDICNRYFQDQQATHLLGGTLVHEYTHYAALTGRYLPLNGLPTQDYAYTYHDAQQLIEKKKCATSKANAENYGFFAEEFFWTQYCGRRTAAPLAPPLPPGQQPPRVPSGPPRVQEV